MNLHSVYESAKFLKQVHFLKTFWMLHCVGDLYIFSVLELSSTSPYAVSLKERSIGMNKSSEPWIVLFTCWKKKFSSSTFVFLFFCEQLIRWVQLWTQVRPPGVEPCAQVWEVLARERRPPEREELRAPQVRRSLDFTDTRHEGTSSALF